MMNNRNVFVTKDLCANLYLIGYSTQGESIIFTVECDGIIDFVAVIDCYECFNENQTKATLDSLGVTQENIDLLCLTHPDEDHATGLSKLFCYEKFREKKHKIEFIFPDGYDLYKDEWKKRDDSFIKFAASQFELNGRDSKVVKNRIVSSGCDVFYKKYIISNENEEYPLEIIAIAPDSFFARRYHYQGKSPNKNRLSLGLLVRIGKIDILLTGDMDNTTINAIKQNNKYFPVLADYLKIPHHGSKSSINILDLLEGDVAISSCTTYPRNGLPDNDILNLYRQKSARLFCTGDLSNAKSNYNYGVVKTTFDIKKSKIKESSLYGNATDLT